MKIKDLSRALRHHFLPAATSVGFTEIGATCVYARRAPEIVQVLAIDTSRHGPRFRAAIYGWIPEFLSDDEARLDAAKMLLSHCCREEYLGAYSIGATKWWSCGTAEEAAESGRLLSQSFLRGAIPWFEKVQTRLDLERHLIPDLPQFVATRLASGSSAPMPAQLQMLAVWTATENP